MAKARAKVGTRAESEDCVRPTEGGVYVKLLVSSGAKSIGIKGLYDAGAIKLSVTAPPTRGNGEIERCLARILEVSRSGVTVNKGVQSHDKIVFVRGLDADEIRARLINLL